MARLDEEDAEPMAIDTDRSLLDDLREIDPTPPLPLTDMHEAGFASLIRRMDKVVGTGMTDQAVVRRILDLVGDRLTLWVGPDDATSSSRARSSWCRSVAPGFSEAVEHEARARGIAVDVEAPTGA